MKKPVGGLPGTDSMGLVVWPCSRPGWQPGNALKPASGNGH